MKKWIICLLCICFLSMPLMVKASEPTDKLYMDITILENGDIKIKELAKLSGSYNGRIRTLSYQNLQAPHFSGKSSDFDGSDIYNGTGITVDKVADIALTDSFQFDSLFDNFSKTYTRVFSTPEVAYGVYEESQTADGVYLKVYNPDRMHRAFYLAYTIQNAVVVHEDVAELSWNILGDSYEENIGTLEVAVHLPQEDDDYRVWLKGPLNGQISKEDNQTARATYDFLGAHNAVTIRLMFDKNLVPLATKMSHVVGKDKILASEQKAADLANKERERIRLENAIIKVCAITWILALLLSFIYLAYYRRKNQKANFQQDYLRDLPANYGPEVLEYLLKRNITEASLSATILSLVEKKILKVEEVKENKKSDFIFTWSGNEEELTHVERAAITLFIKEVGNGQSVSLNEFKKYGKKRSYAQKFINAYNHFLEISKEEGENEKFFIKSPLCLTITEIIIILGFPIAIFILSFDMLFLGIVILILSFVSIFYALSMRFYTEKGREDLAKWKAFKHFLEDFSTFDEKELPELTLWNRYLVYATVLGCAETLQKQMKVKLDTMSTDENFHYDVIFWNRLYLYNSISNSIHQSVHTAVSSSRSSIAASSNSSGGGFGGGASFGGGSFGGGGGGGRF